MLFNHIMLCYSALFQSILVKKTKQEVASELSFVVYGARRTKEKSGPYLFLPDGQASVGNIHCVTAWVSDGR